MNYVSRQLNFFVVFCFVLFSSQCNAEIETDSDCKMLMCLLLIFSPQLAENIFLAVYCLFQAAKE